MAAARRRRCGTRCAAPPGRSSAVLASGSTGSSSARRSARRSLPFGGPRQGLEPDERGRHLEPGEPVAAEGGQRRVVRVGGAARGGRWPRRARARSSASRRATTPASAMAGWSSRTASTSDGEMFSPPRTMRSVRRSSDGQPAVGVETAEVAGPQPAVVGPGGGCHRGLVEVAVEHGGAPDLDLADAVRRRRRRCGARPRGAPGRHSPDAVPPRRSGAPSLRTRPRSGRMSARPASPRRAPAGRGRRRWVRHPAGRREGSLVAARRAVASRTRASMVGDERDVAERGILGQGVAAIAAASGRARTTSGTPDSAARHTTPRPAT